MPLLRHPRFKRWGIVGPVPGADGTTPATGRQGKTGESVVTQVHGKYYESSGRMTVFNACDQGAGVAVPTTISTTSILSLFNPANSKKRLVVLKVSVGYFSGTLGAGAIYHCGNFLGTTAVAAPTSGTLLTSMPSLIGQAVADAAVGVVRTASTVTTPTVLRPFCSMNAILASTATGLFQVTEDVDGEFVVEPGACYQLQAVAASGSTPKIAVGISWEEIPYVGTNG